MQAKGHRFDSDILHGKENKQTEKQTDILTLLAEKRERKEVKAKVVEEKRPCLKDTKANKGAWGMPWLSEAMKGVVSCEKLRIGANGR